MSNFFAYFFQTRKMCIIHFLAQRQYFSKVLGPNFCSSIFSKFTIHGSLFWLTRYFLRVFFLHIFSIQRGGGETRALHRCVYIFVVSSQGNTRTYLYVTAWDFCMICFQHLYFFHVFYVNIHCICTYFNMCVCLMRDTGAVMSKISNFSITSTGGRCVYTTISQFLHIFYPSRHAQLGVHFCANHRGRGSRTGEIRTLTL